MILWVPDKADGAFAYNALHNAARLQRSQLAACDTCTQATRTCSIPKRSSLHVALLVYGY